MIFVDRVRCSSVLFIHLVLSVCFIFFGVVSAFAGSHNVKKRFDPSTSEFSFDATSMISDSGARLDYQWSIVSKPAGSNAVLKQSAGPFSGLTADVSGTFGVELSVAEVGGTTKIIPFTVSTEQLGPEAVFEVRSQSGQQLGTPVILDAASSYHPGGALLQYSWSLLSAPDGSEASVTVSSPYQGSLIPDIAGTYQIELVTTDALGNSSRAERAFTVGQTVSIANAGPDKSVVVGSTVLLDPFSSISPSGKALSAQWHILHRPEGSVAELGEAIKGRVPFSPDTAGHYVIQLSVSGEDEGSNDTVVIVAGAADQTNVAPQAVIAIQSKADVAAKTVLDGSLSSDFDGDPLTYLWALVSAPQASNLSFPSASGPLVDFSPDVAGDYIFSLTVDDGALSDTQTVVVSTARSAVNANAGADLVLPDNRQVSVDGSASIFSGGVSNTYSWSVTGLGTPGAAGASTLSNFQNVSTDIAFNAATGTGAVDGRNLIRNGRFETHNLSPQHGWGLFETIDGWTSPVGLIEIQRHDYHTGNKVGNTIVELDSRSNSTIATTFKTDQAGTYNFSFDYAMRGTNPHSNGLLVKLDGTVIATISPNNFGFKQFEQELSLDQGDHLLEFVGKGRSDSYGTVIDNVFLGLKTSHTLGDELVINGTFEEHNLSSRRGWGIFEVIKGWTSPVGKIEIQTRNYDTGNKTGNAVVELDSRSNSSMEQGVTVLKDGIYELSFDYAMRSRKVATNGIAVLVDGVVVRQIMPHRRGFHSSKISLELERGAHKLAFAALGTSDSYGTVIDNVSLRGKINGTTRAINTAVVQLKVSDGNNAMGGMSFDTLLVTNGAIAPVARIIPSATHADIGTAIQLNGAGSSDANGDTVNYRWALLSKPARSSATLTGNGAAVSIEPDQRGAYVVQLIVSDGSSSGGPNGGLESAPVTVAIFGNNQSPAITSEPVLEGVVGNLYSYTATGTDPDEDTLQWSLATAPDGMTINTQTGEVSWTPTEAGSYNVVIAVKDGNGGTAEQSYTVTTEFGGNTRPPIIDSIANLTLKPGQTAQFTVQGSDPEGEGLTYYINPLPAGASFDPATGVFSITASDEIGTTSVIASVTDGIFSASAPFAITIEPWPDTESTRFSGRVLDAQDFANGIQTPVTGATINIQGKSTTTDNNGEFNFTELDDNTSTNQNLNIDGATATDHTSGEKYGGLSRTVTAYKNGENVLSAPLLLSRFSDQILITETGPYTLPELRSCKFQRIEQQDGSAVALSSLGLVANDPVAQDTKMIVWSRPDIGSDFTQIDQADLAADGTTLTGLSASVPSGSEIFVTPLALVGQVSPLQPKDSYVPSLLGEGNLQTGISTPTYSSLGGSRATSLLYNSVSANPRPIITADITIPAEAALTATLEAHLYVNGQRVPGVTVTQLTNAVNPNAVLPSENETSQVSVSVSFDATAFETGIYPYELYVFAGHSCSAAAAKVDGDVFVSNKQKSPYGTGWKVTELQKIITDPTGNVVIEEVNGGLSVYEIGEIAKPYHETFDSGFGDWAINADGENLTFNAEGGNPGGHIQAFDLVGGDIWYFVAPSSVTENLRGYFEGRLSFDMRQRFISSQFEAWDIIIFGIDENNEEIITGYKFPNFPLTTWTSYSAPLSGEGWKILTRQTDGEFLRFNDEGAATVDFFKSALKSATVFWLRGEYKNGDDNSRLDNVQFIGKDLTGDALPFETPDGHFDRLVKNSDGTYVRQYNNGTAVHFNSEGLQTSIVDRNGNTTSYTYNENGSINTITDPAGLVTQYNYNAQSRLSSIVDPDGRVSNFNYDENGRMLHSALPDESEVQMTYDESGRMISQTDQRGNVTGYGYSGDGRLTSMTTPDSGTVKLEIGRSLGLTQFGVDLGAPSEASFVAPGDRITQLVDPKGNEASQEVNEWGAIVRTTDPVGRVTVFDRDEDNLVRKVTAPSSSTAGGTLVTELDYDDKGNVTSKAEAVSTPLARSMTYEYEPEFSKVTRMVDYAGFATTYTYDEKGNRTGMTNPDGTSTAYTFNDQGQLLTATDERGNTYRREYDTYGRLDKTIDPDGIETRMILDGRGNALITFAAAGLAEEQRMSRTFDAHNRVLSTQNAENEQSSYTYDAAGLQTAAADPTGIRSSAIYDDKDRTQSVTDPSAGTNSMDYDLNDNMTVITNSDGSKTTMNYDPVNRVTSTTDAIGTERRVAYDKRDNVIAVTDGRGNTTTFGFDALDRQISRTNPNGNQWQFEYDPRDLPVAIIKPDGTRFVLSYDNRKRLLSMGVADQPESTRSFTYDDESNLLSATAATGTSKAMAHSFTYDERDLLTKADLAAGNPVGAYSFTYEYDALGRRVAMRDSAGGVTSYLYDKVSRLTSMVVPSGKTVSMAYDDAGRRTQLAFPNGLNASAAFDTPNSAAGGTTGRLLSVAHGLDTTGQGGTPLNQALGTFSYSYDVKGNIVGFNETGAISAAGPRRRSHTLDVLDRLTKVTDGASPDAGATVEQYALDEEGNRTSTHLSTLHVTNANNQLTEDSDHLFEYNANGNLVRKTVKSTSETWRYGYSVYDELTQASRHGDSAADSPALERHTWAYDALGRRLWEQAFDGTNALTRQRVWRYDGSHIARIETYDGTGALVSGTWVSHGDRTDEVVALTLPAGTDTVSPTATTTGPSAPSNQSSYMHTDHQSSVRAVTDDTGAVINEYSYDSYGNAQTTVEGLPQPFRYTGREWDSATALYHYRARVFDPATGRFLQEDPLKFAALHPVRGEMFDNEFPSDKLQQSLAVLYAGELNLYRYVSNNPVNYNDPTGLFAHAIYSRVVRRVKVVVRSINHGIKRETGLLKRNDKSNRFHGPDGKFIPNSSIGNPFSAAQNCVIGGASTSAPQGSLVGIFCQAAAYLGGLVFGR